MIILTIGNSYTRIAGLTVLEEKNIKDLLSYTVGGSSAYFSGYGVHKKSLLGKRGDFPTGLFYRVRAYLDKNNISYTTSSNVIIPKPSPIRIECPKPYEDQLLAVETAMKHHRGIISMPTGTGKSLVIALLTARLGLRTLIVVPSLEIRKQLTDSLREALGSKQCYDVEHIDSTTLASKSNYDCLIIDEAHHSAAKKYRRLNKTAWNNIYYRFFLTATPFRSDPEEILLFESIAGEVIFKLDYKTAIKKKYIVPVKAYYIDIPKQKTDAYTYREVYNNLVVNNQKRNEIISALLSNLKSSKVSTLCLVKEINHGHIIKDMSGVLFTSGEDNDTRQYIEMFNKNAVNTLIGTTGILGEGVDTKPCEWVIIAGLGKSKVQFMQQIGRGVRTYNNKTSCKIVLFRDASHKFLLRHFNSQCKVLKEEYGIVPIKLKEKV